MTPCAPGWIAIFKCNPQLSPPGYAETLICISKNPYKKPKDLKKDEATAKKKKKKLGRGQKA